MDFCAYLDLSQPNSALVEEVRRHVVQHNTGVQGIWSKPAAKIKAAKTDGSTPTGATVERPIETPKQLAARVNVSERQIRESDPSGRTGSCHDRRSRLYPYGRLVPVHRQQTQEENMSRRNQGAKLRWREDRGAFYITWTVNGRSRKRTTGTADREAAESIFAEWLHARSRPTRPSDPAQILVTDVLNDYATERGPKIIGKETLANAVTVLARLWEGKTVAEVPAYIDTYIKRRDRAAGTVRRELGVLQAAINLGHKKGRLTRSVAVELPTAPTSKQRWLTRQEAAALIRAARKDKKARVYMPLFILIALYTGRRKEAILSLRWSQVDLDRHPIRLRDRGPRAHQEATGEGSHSPASSTSFNPRPSSGVRSRSRSAYKWTPDSEHQKGLCRCLSASRH